jgi:DNA-binding CsgD family transcriptional regulator
MVIIAIIIILALIILFYLRVRKPKIIVQKVISNTSPEDYNRLLEMAKKDDTAFISAFRNMYPEFLEKLQEDFQDLSVSEIELCALIKLNLSTKEIAANKNLSYRTIQNKKYNLRKKLNIPAEMDIYKWMDR